MAQEKWESVWEGRLDDAEIVVDKLWYDSDCGGVDCCYFELRMYWDSGILLRFELYEFSPGLWTIKQTGGKVRKWLIPALQRLCNQELKTILWNASRELHEYKRILEL